MTIATQRNIIGMFLMKIAIAFLLVPQLTQAGEEANAENPTISHDQLVNQNYEVHIQSQKPCFESMANEQGSQAVPAVCKFYTVNGLRFSASIVSGRVYRIYHYPAEGDKYEVDQYESLQMAANAIDANKQRILNATGSI